jgi:group II intron reverse transcriptase/maturase
MLKLIRQWLKAGVLDGGEFVPSDQGVPQGGVVSCVLANVVLHELDRLWEDRCSQLGQLIRYADDAVLLCRTEQQAHEALWRVGVILSRLKLTLHPTKTQVVYVGDGRQGFDFLGFHCRKVESWKYRGKRYLHQWPGKRAMQRIRDKIKAITAPRHRLPEPAGPIVAEINQALRHWGPYFRVGNSARKFQQVDDYVRERLALFLSKKSGHHGRRREHYTSTYLKGLGVYRLNGAVAWYTAAPTAAR